MPDTPGRVIMRTRRHARVTFSALMRGLSVYARMAVPTSGDRHVPADCYVRMGRHISLLAQEIKFAGVVIMLEEGRDWEDVASAVGLPDADAAQSIYEDPYERWKHGDPNPWRARIPGIAALPTDAYGDPDILAAALDAWCSAADGISPPHAVSSGLY